LSKAHVTRDNSGPATLAITVQHAIQEIFQIVTNLMYSSRYVILYSFNCLLVPFFSHRK